MLGVACAPGLGPLEAADGLVRGVRWVGAAVVGALALVAVPLFFGAAYLNRAEGKAAGDPAAAVGDYKRAAELNPLSDQPLIGKSVVEARVGDEALAVQTLHEASGRVPDDYVPYYLLGEVLAESNPAAARAAAAKARSLNPRGPEVIELQQLLAESRQRQTGG
jgi:tetratricopeptide (TPR) repeat protein